MNLLVTFGCSWTIGMYSWYDADIPLYANMKTTTDCKKYQHQGEGRTLKDEYCFRTILSRRHNYVNVNHAGGGSSNCKQFRRAEEYFNTDDYKNYDNVIVLWGLTSTARLELWSLKSKNYENYFITDDRKDLTNILRKHHYDYDVEVKRLSTQIEHWDKYFKMIGVNNYWFDTFNHHNYDYQSPNMIMGNQNPRDLMSVLCKSEGLLFNKDHTHFSEWISDCNRIKFLARKKLVNPISYHPTRQAHILLADILDKHILW